MRISSLRWFGICGLALVPALVLWLEPFSRFALFTKDPDAVYLARQRADEKRNIERMRALKIKALPGYLWSEKVSWKDYHDPGYFYLQDGRVLTLKSLQLGYSTTEKWQAGKELFLCYDEARGVTLLDPVAGVSLPVIEVGEGSHPIDSLVAKLDPMNTYDIVQVGQESSRLWRLEIDRLVGLIREMKYLRGEKRDNFEKLVLVRLEYVHLQRQLAIDGLYRSYYGGTIAGPYAADYEARLVQRVYSQLSELYQDLVSFETESAQDKER